MDQEQAINIVLQYISNLNTHGMQIKKAYLYGSYAKKTHSDSSDIDVMLISDLFDTDDDRILSTPWSPKIRFDYRIEPVAIGTKQFQEDDATPIIQIVKKEGLSIF